MLMGRAGVGPGRACRPGKTNFHLVGRGPTRPFKLVFGGPWRGPASSFVQARHIFIFFWPGSIHQTSKIFGSARAGPSHWQRGPEDPGSARAGPLKNKGRPVHLAHSKNTGRPVYLTGRPTYCPELKGSRIYRDSVFFTVLLLIFFVFFCPSNNLPTTHTPPLPTPYPSINSPVRWIPP